MPIALYYKAMLNEYSPDLRRIQQDETLHFYSDYPQELSSRIWFRLYNDSRRTARNRPRPAGGRPSCSPDRRSWRRPGRSSTDADGHRREASWRSSEKPESAPSDSLFSAFRRPPDTVMTLMKLRELQGRIYELQMLISDENLAGADGALERLAAFVMLNPYSLDYERQLDSAAGGSRRERRPARQSPAGQGQADRRRSAPGRASERAEPPVSRTPTAACRPCTS